MILKTRKQSKRSSPKIADTLGPKQKIFDRLGVLTLTEAEKALDRAKEKAGLQSRKAEEEGHIFGALDKSSMAEAEAALKDLDLATLADEKAAAEDQFNEASTRQQDLFAEKSKLDDQLEAFSSDAAVALIEEKRRAILLEIEDKARRWLRCAPESSRRSSPCAIIATTTRARCWPRLRTPSQPSRAGLIVD